MSTFRSVRVSKFRHVYGQSSRRENCYEGIRITGSAHDSQFCAVNPKFVAVVLEVTGGGAFQVLPLKWTGKVDYHFGRVSGHSGPVNDIKWNPFNDNVIASGSDDCTIKLWHIPDDGVKTVISSPLCELCGHSRKVSYIEWHPTADNVLASAGADYRVIIWNIGTGECLTVIESHEDAIYSLAFNFDGSLLATTCKDKFLRLIDPRSGQVLQETFCHEGSKASKVTFVGTNRKLLTTGFSRSSHRQYAIWDQDNLSQPLVVEEIDSSAGVLFPFYDADLGIVYLAGKGDGNVRFYEILDSKPWIHYLSEFQSRFPQRGLGFMPKRGLDVNHCEIFRFYKVHTSQSLVEPLSFIVPRKSESFQIDLYPPTPGPTPALSAEEWMCGIDKEPIRISLRNGFLPSTNKPVHLKMLGHEQKPLLITSDRNNERKFQFLSQVTKADYREVTQREDYPDLLKQEQLQSKLYRRSFDKESVLASENGSGGESAEETTGIVVHPEDHSPGDVSNGVSVQEEVAQLQINGTAVEVTSSLPQSIWPKPDGDDSFIELSTTALFQESSDDGKTSLKTSSLASSLLPPPRSPFTLSAPSGSVGHSPSKMRRISASPVPPPSPFREVQLDVVSCVSDNVLYSEPDTGRLGVQTFTNGSADGASSFASSEASNVADAVSLPPNRIADRSATPVLHTSSNAAEHSHIHAHVHTSRSVGSPYVPTKPPVENQKRITKPGVITSGPIIPREHTSSAKPFRITQSQPPTPRESSSSETSAGGKKDSEVQALYVQQCKRIRELMDDVDTKDQRVNQLEKDVTHLTTKVEQLQHSFNQQKDEIDSLRYEISWKDNRIGYLENQLKSHQT